VRQLKGWLDRIPRILHFASFAVNCLLIRVGQVFVTEEEEISEGYVMIAWNFAAQESEENTN